MPDEQLTVQMVCNATDRLTYRGDLTLGSLMTGNTVEVLQDLKVDVTLDLGLITTEDSDEFTLLVQRLSGSIRLPDVSPPGTIEKPRILPRGTGSGREWDYRVLMDGQVIIAELLDVSPSKDVNRYEFDESFSSNNRPHIRLNDKNAFKGDFDLYSVVPDSEDNYWAYTLETDFYVLNDSPANSYDVRMPKGLCDVHYTPIR